MRLAAVDGEIVWLEAYGGAAALDDWGWSIAIGPDGHPVVTGIVQNADLSASFLTRKHRRSDGGEIWTRLEPGAVYGVDRNGWVAIDPAGDVIMASRTWAGAASYDVFVQKYATADGATLWSRQYNSPGNRADDIRDMCLDGAGNVVIAGVSYGNYLTLKLDGATGAVAWVANYNGPPGWYDQAAALAIGPAGEIMTTGYSDGGVTSGWDVTTVAYAPSDGAELWCVRWDGEAHQSDAGVSSVVGSDRDLYVVGYSYGVTSDMDLLALRYELRAPAAAPEAQSTVTAMTIHPNPCNPIAVISLRLPTSAAWARLDIHDLRGRRLARLHAGPLVAGRHEIRWGGDDASGRALPSGVYLARLVTERGVASVRLVLAR